MSDWPDHIIGSGSRRRSRTSRSRRRGADNAGPGMYLRSARVTLPSDPSLLSPHQRVAVVEDLWWCIESEDHSAHRPHWWRPGEIARWREEGRALADKRRRIRELVDR